jgi:putative ABC transport system permease protein
MTWWQRLWRRKRLEEELDKELRVHLDQHTDDLIAQGYAPEEARRQAVLALGGAEQVKEECRDARGTRWLEDLLRDFHYAFRRLRSNPGFTAICVVTLALGIGATSAIFSAVNPILLDSLPYPHAGRVTMISELTADGDNLDITFGTYRELIQRSHSFDALSVMKPWQPTIIGTAQPERLVGQRVSSNYFRVLGVSPVLGRDFDAFEDQFKGPNVVVINAGLWHRRFGGDVGIVGQQITLNDNRFTVIGVMPNRFDNVLAPSAEVWSPLQYDITLPTDGREWGHHLRMVGRLSPDVTTDKARRELNAIAHNPVQEFPRVPWATLKQGFIVNSLQDEVTRGVKPALLAILGAVVLVLILACVNVTNLLLARGAQRRGEFAMRAALGAQRGRMIRQLLTESVLLALIGGTLGMLVAEVGVRAIVALSPPELPRLTAIRIDGSVFAFGLGITTLIGLLVGLFPALHVSQNNLQISLQQNSRSRTGGNQLTRRTLVVAEVALALVLLVGAGLLLRSLQRLFSVAPGFDTSNVVTMQLQISGSRYADDRAVNRFFAQALEAVSEVPGVTSAGFTSQLPLSGDLEKYGVQFESSPNDDPREDHSALIYSISPGYFETMRIPLRRGRSLNADDVAGKPVAVVINESFAKRKFLDQDPIGHRVHVGRPSQEWYTIVGVVGDVKQTSLAMSTADAVYISAVQWYSADLVRSLVVRTRGEAAALDSPIKAAIWSVDKDQSISRIATMDDLRAASAAERRFALILFECFGILALILAATGIYGVLSGSVSERKREIGVRAALGASRNNIFALVIREGLVLTGLGVMIGLSAALAASQAIVTLLFGISRVDPVTYLVVIAMMVGVSLLACWLPAWRAARVDPAITLRAE